MLLRNEQVKYLILPLQIEETVAPSITTAPSPAILFVALIVAAIIVTITVIVLLKAPVSIAKAGKTATTKAADSVVPLITHGRPIPEKEKRRLTARLIKLIKLLAVLLPVILVMAFNTIVSLPLSFELVLLVTCMMALGAIFWFSMQYILARAFGVSLDSLV